MDSVCEPGLDSQSPRITLALWMRRMSNYEIDKKNMEKGLKPVIHNREARKAIRSLAAHIALPASFPICHSEPRSGEESAVCRAADQLQANSIFLPFDFAQGRNDNFLKN